jgi:ABC-type oligopeptide transport system ATPase subunit
MDNGAIVETGKIDDVFNTPRHPATEKLVAAEKSDHIVRNRPII